MNKLSALSSKDLAGFLLLLLPVFGISQSIGIKGSVSVEKGKSFPACTVHLMGNVSGTVSFKGTKAELNSQNSAYYLFSRGNR